MSRRYMALFGVLFLGGCVVGDGHDGFADDEDSCVAPLDVSCDECDPLECDCTPCEASESTTDTSAAAVHKIELTTEKIETVM